MSVDNKVPEIRFKGFSEAWVDSDLKSFSDSFSYGLNASAVKFDGVNKYLRITDIDEKSRHFDYCQLTSPDADLSKSDNYLLKKGDILFARTGASVGKTYIYNEQDGKVYFAGFLIRASINHKASAQFIFQNTQTHEYARFVATTSQRSGQPGINAKEYGEYRLFSPTEPEQTQIGNYFQKLDTLISQHQQKHDKLSNIKKAMLEKMFPKQGETIPEIRFKGFSGEWEERELGELAEIVRGASPRPIEDPKWFDSQSSVGWLRIRDVTEQDGRIHYLEQRISRLGQEKTRVLHEKHLLLSIAASVGKPVVNYVETGVHDGFLIFKKPLFELEFMYQWLKSFEAKWQQFGQPGSQVNLNSDIVKSLVVTIPTNEEQTAIGNYFEKLDALIDQHQQQITKLNNIKQACLSKMFV
ncbi:MAG: restriction endonuclease subunit S [Serratia grimesii]|jgi:type I restriction enzyme S subunit|uniref:restriction endonuclease subunit S n=1 Tax=Serratia grimesii TaxID=82995 RepID=UPI003F963DB3